MFVNRNVTTNLLINVEKTIYTAPEVLEFFRNHCQDTDKTLEISLLEERLTKTDVYSFGRIISKVYGVDTHSTNGKGLFSGKVV